MVGHNDELENLKKKVETLRFSITSMEKIKEEEGTISSMDNESLLNDDYIFPNFFLYCLFNREPKYLMLWILTFPNRCYDDKIYEKFLKYIYNNFFNNLSPYYILLGDKLNPEINKSFNARPPDFKKISKLMVELRYFLQSSIVDFINDFKVKWEMGLATFILGDDIQYKKNNHFYFINAIKYYFIQVKTQADNYDDLIKLTFHHCLLFTDCPYNLINDLFLIINYKSPHFSKVQEMYKKGKIKTTNDGRFILYPSTIIKEYLLTGTVDLCSLEQVQNSMNIISRPRSSTHELKKTRRMSVDDSVLVNQEDSKIGFFYNRETTSRNVTQIYEESEDKQNYSVSKLTQSKPNIVSKMSLFQRSDAILRLVSKKEKLRNSTNNNPDQALELKLIELKLTTPKGSPEKTNNIINLHDVPPSSFKLAYPKTAKSLTKKELEVQEAIYELILTEKTYICQLILLFHVFKPELETIRILRSNIVKSLFFDLDILLDIHCNFLRLLTFCVGPNGTVEDLSEPICYITTAEINENIKNAYSYNCSLHTSSLNVFKENVKSNIKITQHFEKLRSFKCMKRLDFSDIKSTVYQRISKYPLLLQQIIKASNSQAKHYSCLTTALNIFKVNLQHVNEAMKEYDCYLKLNEIKSKMITRLADNFIPQGYDRVFNIDECQLVSEGKFLCELSKDKPFEICMLLLDELVVFLQFTLDGKYLLGPITTKKVTVDPVYPIRPILVREMATSKNGIFLISNIKKGSNMFQLICDDEKQKKFWLELLNHHINRVKKGEKLNIYLDKSYINSVFKSNLGTTIRRTNNSTLSNNRETDSRSNNSVPTNKIFVNNTSEDKVENTINSPNNKLSIKKSESVTIRKKKFTSLPSIEKRIIENQESEYVKETKVRLTKSMSRRSKFHVAKSRDYTQENLGKKSNDSNEIQTIIVTTNEENNEPQSKTTMTEGDNSPKIRCKSTVTNEIEVNKERESGTLLEIMNRLGVSRYRSFHTKGSNLPNDPKKIINKTSEE